MSLKKARRDSLCVVNHCLHLISSERVGPVDSRFIQAVLGGSGIEWVQPLGLFTDRPRLENKADRIKTNISRRHRRVRVAVGWPTVKKI